MSDATDTDTEQPGMWVCGKCSWEGVPEAFEQFRIMSVARDAKAKIRVCDKCRRELTWRR